MCVFEIVASHDADDLTTIRSRSLAVCGSSNVGIQLPSAKITSVNGALIDVILDPTFCAFS